MLEIPVLNEKTISRFWSKVDIKGEDDCWPYLNYTDKDGYGNFWITIGSGKGATFRANRVSLFIKTG